MLMYLLSLDALTTTMTAMEEEEVVLEEAIKEELVIFVEWSILTNVEREAATDLLNYNKISRTKPNITSNNFSHSIISNSPLKHTSKMVTKPGLKTSPSNSNHYHFQNKRSFIIYFAQPDLNLYLGSKITLRKLFLNSSKKTWNRFQ